MPVSYKQTGEELAKVSGWKPESKKNSARSVGFVVGLGAGILTLCLSGQPAFPANVFGALLVGVVAGGITYGVLSEMNSKTEALAAGRILKKKMKSGKWVVEVWENLGWHFKIRSRAGHLSIYPSYSGTGPYHTDLCEIKDGCGTPCALSVSKSYNNPNNAVKGQLKHLKKYFDEQTTMLNKLVWAVEEALQ